MISMNAALLGAMIGGLVAFAIGFCVGFKTCADIDKKLDEKWER